MRHRILTAIALLTVAAPLVAQGKLPRTADGHPDLQGIWQVLNTASWDIQDHSAHLGVPAGRGVVEGNEIPYQAWAATKKQVASISEATTFTTSWKKSTGQVSTLWTETKESSTSGPPPKCQGESLLSPSSKSRW